MKKVLFLLLMLIYETAQAQEATTVTVEVTATTADITWTAVEGNTRYQVWHWQGGTYALHKMPMLNIECNCWWWSGTQAHLVGLFPNSSYQLWITGGNPHTTFATEFWVRTAEGPPSVPAGSSGLFD